MNDLTAVITGASSGLGLWTARQLAPHASRLALVCRDRARAEEAARFVKESAPDSLRVDLWIADLSSLSSVRAAAMEMREAYSKVNVLINNAGAVFGPRRLSADGIELHLATNYAGHFLLTALLLDRLAAAPEARIINLTSFLHAFGRIRFHDLAYTHWYHVVPAYAQSKLALVLFTCELARRTRGLALTANCVDPGVVRTGIHRGAGPIQRQFAHPLLWFAKEPREGAESIAALALDPTFKGYTGQYFLRTRPRRPGRRGRDPDVSSLLWERSCEWLEARERAALDMLLESARAVSTSSDHRGSV